MTQRNSTIANSFRGKDVKSQYDGNQFNNTFGGGDGTEQSPPPELAKLLGEATVPASVDSITYNVIKAYFVSKGSSQRNASAMVLLIIDAAKLQNTSPMKLLEEFKTANVSLSDTMQYAVNMLSGSTTSRIGTATTKDNSKSYKSRLINPKPL